MVEQLGEYEYAGFKYKVSRVTTNSGKSHIFLEVLPGQHPAAGKDKHLRTALSCYMEDEAWRGYGAKL